MRHSPQRAIAVDLLVIVLASMLLFASGCRREEVSHFRVKKAPDSTAASVLPRAFMDSAFRALAGFIVSQLVLIAFSLLPRQFWNQRGVSAGDRPEPA